MSWHMQRQTFKWTLSVLHFGGEAHRIGEHLIPLPIPCDGICQKLKSFKLTACASSVASQFFRSSQRISHLTSETFSYPIYLWSWYGMTFDKSSRSTFSGSHPFLSSSPKTESCLSRCRLPTRKTIIKLDIGFVARGSLLCYRTFIYLRLSGCTTQQFPEQTGKQENFCLLLRCYFRLRPCTSNENISVLFY